MGEFDGGRAYTELIKQQIMVGDTLQLHMVPKVGQVVGVSWVVHNKVAREAEQEG